MNRLISNNLPDIQLPKCKSVKKRILELPHKALTPQNYLKEQTIAFHHYLYSKTPKRCLKNNNNSTQKLHRAINPFNDEPRLSSYFDIIPERVNPLLPLPSLSSSHINNRNSSFNRNSSSLSSLNIHNHKFNTKTQKEEIDPTKTDELAEMIIKQYISNTIPKAIDNQHRKLFVILDGTVLMNNKVRGIYADLPRHDIIAKMTKAKRMKTMICLLQKCTLEMRTSTNLLSAFTYQKHPLYDLINLEEEHKYIIVSNRNMCYGIHIMPSKSLKTIYHQNIINFINDKKIRREAIHTKYKEAHQRKILQKRLISHKVPKSTKHNKTFTDGESISYDKYDYNSDNEDRIKSTRHQINLANITNKYDFQLYLYEKDLSSNINNLHKLLHYNKSNPFNFAKSSCEHKSDYDAILKRFIKEQNINKSQLLTKQKVTINKLLADNIEIHNMLYPNNKYNIIRKSKLRYPYLEKNAQKNDFYQVMDRHINKKYPDFFSFNIPKFEAKYKKFNRRELYAIFCTYKMLISLCYGMNKNNLIIRNGIDLPTFWKCTKEIFNESKEFVEKLFIQINKTKSNLLSLNEFFEGMTFLQSNDIKEKLDLFLKTIDQSSKGLLSYNDTVMICSQSIQRNFTNEENIVTNENESLELLSKGFAEFIFKLLDLNKEDLIPLEIIQDAIVKGSVESQYLEMFCGTSKISNK